MKEHYVSYEQAIALKRLGFDWKCDHYYDDFDELQESEKLSRTLNIVSDYRYNFNEYNRDNHGQFNNVECSAPRLDQAQSWLRQEYAIHVSSEPHYASDLDMYCWSANLTTLLYKDKKKCSDLEYETYEEALSNGIDMALELLGKEIGSGV